MKKLQSFLLITVSLFLCSIGLAGCQTTTPPPTLSTIELTESNLFDYVSFNVNYSEYNIVYIDNEYLITCKIEISTSPRIPDIEFEKCTITYATGFIAIGFNLQSNETIVSQLDYKGYSITSFYCYNTSTSYYPPTSFPLSNITRADISSVEGFVLVEE